MKRSYRVTADIKTNRHEYAYVVDVIACNKKEAVETAVEMWKKYRSNHLFHVKARRLLYRENFTFKSWTETGRNW